MYKYYFPHAMYNALLSVSRNAVPVAHRDKVDSRSQMVEESTDYRGYTNPNVQSRSFKIIQQSLSVEEAEEGTFEPSGSNPGEMIVVRAHNEGKKRMAELSETHPRNFTTTGMPGTRSYKGRAAYYGIDEFDDFDKAQKFRESGGGKDAQESISAKRFEGTQSTPRQRPPAQNANAQSQYKLLSDDIDVTDSILSPNVQGRRPMVVKMVSNEQQSVQTNAGIAQTQRVQHVSQSQAGVNIQQQAPVHNDVRMTHMQNISVGSSSQAPANIQRTQQAVQQNAQPMNIQTSAVTQQSQKQINYNTNMTQVMSQNAQTPAPSVIQPNAAVIQSQTTVVRAPAAKQPPQPTAPQALNIMHVEKTPSVIAPVPVAPTEEKRTPHRRVRPTRAEAKAEVAESQQTISVIEESKPTPAAEAKAEVIESQQTISVIEESKPIPAVPESTQKVPEQAVQAEAKLEETTEVDQTSVTDLEKENKKNIIENEVASEEAIAPEVTEEKAELQDQTNEDEGKSFSEVQQQTSMEPVSITQENETPTETLEPPIQIKEEPTTNDSLQTLPTREASDSTANENVEVVKETEAKQSPESEIQSKSDINENTETSSFENDINLKIESESQKEIVETVVETVEVSEEKSQTKLKEDVSENVSIENESIQTAEKEVKIETAENKVNIETTEKEVNIETAEAKLNVEMSVVTENTQEITIQSASENETQNTQEAHSFTLKLDDDTNQQGINISLDSAEFAIDTTNIEITREADTTSVEVNEAVVDVNLVSEEKVNTSDSTDVNLSLNEEKTANVVIGLAEEKSSDNVNVQNDDAVEFSITLNEETVSDNTETKKEDKPNEKSSEQQNVNAVSDKDVTINEKESEDKKVANEVSNKKDVVNEVSAEKKVTKEASNKEDVKEEKSVEEKAQAKTENNKPKSKVSPSTSDKDDKKSAPWRSRKTNFVDSQGGVAARLQRLQKK